VGLAIELLFDNAGNRPISNNLTHMQEFDYWGEPSCKLLQLQQTTQ